MHYSIGLRHKLPQTDVMRPDGVMNDLAGPLAGIERFKVMERKLYNGIMMPGMVLSLASGLWLWLGYGFTGGWLHTKVALMLVLAAASVVPVIAQKKPDPKAESAPASQPVIPIDAELQKEVDAILRQVQEGVEKPRPKRVAYSSKPRQRTSGSWAA